MFYLFKKTVNNLVKLLISLKKTLLLLQKYIAKIIKLKKVNLFIQDERHTSIIIIWLWQNRLESLQHQSEYNKS